MSTQTHIAHCGGCGEIMMLCRGYRAIYWIYSYVCPTCGEETHPRMTVAEADADVVRVPVKPTKKERAHVELR